MTGCSSVESGTLTLQGYEEGRPEEIQETMSLEASEQKVGSTLERMQEEEGLQKAVMPNLRRAETHSAALKRIETILEKVEGYRSDETLLECIQVLAPIDPTFALKWIEKIQNNDLKIEALVTIAKHEGNEDALFSLSVAEILCPLDNLTLITQIIDEGKRRGFVRAEELLTKTCDRLNKESGFSIEELEFMHHFQVPGFEEGLKDFHNSVRYNISFEESARLLQLEIEIDSPLKHETLKRLRDDLRSIHWGSESPLKLLLPIEGRVPAFRKEYLEDLEFLYQKVPNHFTYLGWRETADSFIKMIDQAPSSFLEKLYENESLGNKFKPYVYLEILKRRLGEEEVSLKDESRNIRDSFYYWYDTDFYVDLFIRYAEVFGTEEAQLLLDMAIEEAYWGGEDFDEILISDIAEERRTLSHYGAKLFGMDNPHPKGEEDVFYTKLSKVWDFDVCDLLKAYATFNLLGTKELLSRAHRMFEAKNRVWSEDALNIIRAEVALLETESK